MHNQLYQQKTSLDTQKSIPQEKYLSNSYYVDKYLQNAVR